MGKKKKNKQKNHASGENKQTECDDRVRELTEENEMLRARLEKIADLADLPGGPLLHDEDEEDEDEELRRDVDDEIEDDVKAGRIEPVNAD